MPRFSTRVLFEDLAEAKREAKGSERCGFRLPGGGQILLESRRERNVWEGFTAALKSGEIKPEEISLQEMFDSAFPGVGYELRENWRQGGSVSLMEAVGAVSAAQFANISGQVIYTKIMEAYEQEEFVFSKIVKNVTTQFRGERIPGIGGIGNQALVVDEGQPYPLAGLVEDYRDTPMTFKYGLGVDVTKEAIFFDRTGLVMQRAAAVGEELGYAKELRLINAFIDENATAHRYKWRGTSYANYQATTPWINLKASNALLDWSRVDAAEQLFANMVDPNTGKAIVLKGVSIVCTPSLAATAQMVINALGVALQAGGFATSGNLYRQDAASPLGKTPYSARYGLVSSRTLAAQMATDTSWFLSDVSGTVEYMENWPITVATAPAGNEAEFTRDIVQRTKASEMGAAAVADPRKTIKNTA